MRNDEPWIPIMPATKTAQLPPWVVLHIPHASTVIPAEYRAQFVLDDRELERELLLMTDHFIDELFAPLVTPERAVRFDVSRLVLDPERFEDDAQEIMSARGMGVIYRRTAGLRPLRRPLLVGEREALLERYYRPHHRALEQVVDQTLDRYGRCLILDCHSFPARALPYELNPEQRRPELCIGTDPFHTPSLLAEAFRESFVASGFDTAFNEPFAGALAPMKYYGRDARVAALMVEVRRDIYMDEGAGEKLGGFERIARGIRGCCLAACSGDSVTRFPE